MAQPLNLTIAIPVKNEELNLPACLAAIGDDFAKSVVVIDSNSTDNTKAIAKEWGCKVIDFKWDGKFPKKRNWFLRNHTPQTEWVMFLDADEHVTNAFKNEVRAKITESGKSGYWLNFTIYFLGKKLKGGYPLRKLALFKVGSGEYEHIDEQSWSHLDMEVHEHPILSGKTGVIYNKIDHRDFRGVTDYIQKHNTYATWEATRFIKLNAQSNVNKKLTWKQKTKYAMLKNMLIGPFYFLGAFVFLGGFLDGLTGLAFAILKMSYFTQVSCKIKEIQSASSPKKQYQPETPRTQPYFIGQK